MINIKLETSEARRFFGGCTATAKAIGITHSYVSQWGAYVPETQAFKLLYLSKLPQYRRRGKLQHEVTVT